MDGERIPIRFGRLEPLLVACGMTPARSFIELRPDTIRVRLGWAFAAEVPRSSVRSARRVGNSLSIGVHGLRGRWLVNGAAGPLVALELDPPARARMLQVFGLRVRELTVSVDDPERVVAAIGPD